jgi:glycosidase
MNKIIRNAWFLALFAIALYSCTGSVKQDTGTQQESTALENSEQGVFHPEWSKNATIYEVNVRQYTKEGTFKAFAEHLTRLRQMGVDILWFMPIHPISEKNRKGTLGSYYAVQDYKAVNPEFGTLEDFKSVVDQAHDMGFKVLIDWVANHTGWDNQWIKDHPEWYKKDSTGNMIAPFDWTDVAQLDYGNQEMREAMIDALSYWVSEADIDGYRCDVAGMVPVDFWANAREQLNEIKPVFMLAEDESEIALLEEAFNMNYGWEFHHIMNGIAKGKKMQMTLCHILIV